MPLWFIHLIEVQLDGFREIIERLVRCVPLAGNIHLKALRYVPVLFLVHSSGERTARRHMSRVTPHSYLQGNLLDF